MTAEAHHPATASSGDTRHRGRQSALQMLYQWEVGRMPIDEVCQSFWTVAARDAPGESLRSFAERLARGVAANAEHLDPLISEAAEHWRLERMNVMDRLILRLAVYEFLHEGETPGKVIINEALELARSFSTDESVRFINGVLDAIRRTIGRE